MKARSLFLPIVMIIVLGIGHLEKPLPFGVMT
jgi:hypothetical protein